MAKELEALEAAINENTDLDESIIQLVAGLAAQIEASKTDPIKLQELADKMKASSVRIKDEVLNKTPAEPPA